MGEWLSEDFTEHAMYMPEVDAVRYMQNVSEYDEDGLRIPRFVEVWLSEDAVRGILDLFPKPVPAAQDG